MSTITGIFDNKFEANRAVAELLDAKFSKDNISILVSDKARDTMFTGTDDEASRAVKGGAAGATIGGVAGAILAGLTAVGSIAIPGAGLLVAGPIVATLAGAGAGAAVGGLSGALIRAGYAADEANKYEAEVNAGKAVIIVHVTDDAQAAAARRAMGPAALSVKAA